MTMWLQKMDRDMGHVGQTQDRHVGLSLRGQKNVNKNRESIK